MTEPASAAFAAPDQVPDIVLKALPEDERLWVPQAPNVWFRPLMFNVVTGAWVNLLKVTRAGVLNRHLHPAPVFGYVIKGSWRYLEHDWIATEGSFVYEPPGEVHTLVVDDNVEEMITLFQVQGALIYVDESGAQVAYDNVHTKIRLARDHYRLVGIGAHEVDRLIR